MEKEKLVSLVTKAQQGDNDALNILFNEFYNDLYYFALKTVKDDETALDVTQEAFVEIINTLGNLKEPAAFVTWAKQITYHQCTRYFKKKKDVIVDEDEEGATIFDTLTEDNAEFIPDEALDKADFKKIVMVILDELSEEQRSATMMYYFDEMSVKEIAEIQGVSEGTVKSRLNYARKTIKAAVEDYEKKNNIKLHAIPFFPFFKWLFEGAFEGGMPVVSAKMVAEGVSATTGSVITIFATTGATATVATTVGTATAIGFFAKIAALPLTTKIISCVVAGAIIVGGTTVAVKHSQKDGTALPTNNQTDDTSSEEVYEDIVLEGTIPEGFIYTLYDGTVLTAGQNFPENCTAGDKVSYGDYLYGYECVYAKNIEGTDTWHMWKDGFDSGDSGVIESDVFGSWSVMVADQTKTSYGEIIAEINGKPVKTLYGTFYGCTNMTKAPPIPSTVKAMPSAFWGCSSLKKAPTIPSNVERIMMTFKDCTSLTGDVVINAKLDKSLQWYYSETFSGTKNKINLTGSTPEEDLILIAKNSDNKNITVNGKSVFLDASNNQSEDGGNQPDGSVNQPGGSVNQPEAIVDFIVPDGCKYITYSSGKVYEAGDTVETAASQGDLFIDSDYCYGYKSRYSYDKTTDDFELTELLNYGSGWTCAVIDKTKKSYGSIQNYINGEPIRDLNNTFEDCYQMIDSPVIPNTVTDMLCTFYNCKSLNFPPAIPSGVTNMMGTFGYCVFLRSAPVIPNGVTVMECSFQNCFTLDSAPVIPNSVTDMSYTFSNCKSLKSAPVIPNSVVNLAGTFELCDSLESAPVIPNSVADLSGTFSYCNSLTGTVTINAKELDSESIYGCFEGTDKPIILTGSSPYLAELAATAENGNVTVG